MEGKKRMEMAQAIRLPSYLQQKATVIHATKARDTNRFLLLLLIFFLRKPHCLAVSLVNMIKVC